jgi:hypothetical protein
MACGGGIVLHTHVLLLQKKMRRMEEFFLLLSLLSDNSYLSLALSVCSLKNSFAEKPKEMSLISLFLFGVLRIVWIVLG